MSEIVNRIALSMQHQISMDDFFNTIKHIAVIGASSKMYRTSFHVAEYLQQNGYHILPVNPHEKEVLGERCVPTIHDLSPEQNVDVMLIFRNKQYTTGIVKEILRWSEKTDHKPVIWTQMDVSTEQAKELAEKNGFTYIENECLMSVHSAHG